MKETSVGNGLKVVLNGGSSIMESATIPFRWFFSDEIIEKQPTDLLIIDQGKSVIGTFNVDSCGERTIVPVSRGSDFMQFTSPGHHRIAFIALKKSGRSHGDENNFVKWKEAILGRSRMDSYRESITWNEIENLNFLMDDIRLYAVAVEIVEIDVPSEFFAARSNNPVARFVWDYWANRWCEAPPRDQCAYRKRLFWAFTLQPFVFVIGHILKYIAALVCSIYLPVAKVVVFFVGFRPEPLFADIGKLWAWKWDPEEVDWDLRRYSKYALWSEDAFWQGDKYKYMPITGFEISMITLLAGAWYGSYRLTFFTHDGSLSAQIFFSSVLAIILLLLTGLFFAKSGIVSRTKLWQKVKRKSLEQKNGQNGQVETKVEQPPSLYFEWLRKVSSISKAPQRIDIEDLPDAYKGKSLQRARIKFWAVKRKVCKPFARS